MGTASEFLLDDAVYENVRDGWNQKLNSSSLKLSGLVPFVELYAVFRTNDVIFSNPTMFSEVANRAVDVKFQYTRAGSRDTAMEFQKRFDIPTQAKIVSVASTAQAQTEEDTIYGSSYRGAAGINDLSVTRGASGPMNIKYSLNMTMPNPEVINDMYEYSKLMILNSSFLLVYGWNPFGFEDHVQTMPPRLVQEPTSAYGGPNIVELNASNGGFYKSSLVNLNRFNFSLDNVGHLGGKLDFLTLAGNFLVTTRANAIGAQCKKMLNGYSGMLFTAGAPSDESTAGRGESAQQEADNWIKLGEDWLEESLAYKNAWEKDMERRLAAGKEYGFGSGNLLRKKSAFQIAGPGGVKNLDSQTKWYGTTKSGDYYMSRAGRDNDLFDTEVGLEVRVNPYGTGTGYYEGNKEEINRFKRFSGVDIFQGSTVPNKYTREADPLLFTHGVFEDTLTEEEKHYLWRPEMIDWNKLGMGFFHEGDKQKRFRGAKIPKRIRIPQRVPSYSQMEDQIRIAREHPERLAHGFYGDVADIVARKAEYDAYRNVWETGPDHEELAASHNYVSDLITESDGTVVQGWKPGPEATEDDKVDYEKRWMIWIEEVIADLTLQTPRQGTIIAGPTQYSFENLKPIPYLEWLIAYYKKEKTTVLGFMNIDSEKGIPWSQPDQLPDEAFEKYGKNREDITTLDTMPSYGRDLMHNIWDEFMEPDNPNRRTFFPVDPDAPSTPSIRNLLGKRYAPPTPGGASAPTQFLDEETVKIMSNSCAISTMLVDVAPPEEESEQDDDRFWGLYFDRFLKAFETQSAEDLRIEAEGEEAEILAIARGVVPPGEVAIDENMNDVLLGLSRFEHTIGGSEENVTGDERLAGREISFITHSKPVYYFLGAVLESFRRALNDKIKFMYDDIPLEGAISPGGFPIPIPKVNSDVIKGTQKEVDELRQKKQEWEDGYLKIDDRYFGAKNSYNKNDFEKYDGEKTKPRASELEAAGYRYPYEDEVRWDKDELKESYMHDGVEWAGALLKPWKNNHDWGPLVHWDLWGKAITTEESERQSALREIEIENRVAMGNVMADNTKEVLSTIMCKNVFELPVEISVVRKILSEGNAPLHNVINKLLKACDATTKTVRLSTRPYAADETYLEIFVANLRVDGATTQVFEDLDIHSFLQSNQVREDVMRLGITTEQVNIAKGVAKATPAEFAAARQGIMGAFFSAKAVVCEFGSERSLVESFNLSSKVDPLAFASFRLPDVIGGQSIDIAEVVRSNIKDASMGFMNDIRGILEKGMFSGKEQLRDLNIIGATTVGSSREVVNTRALKAFLLAENAAATKIQTTFLTNLMAANQELNTKIIALQNEAITSSGDPNNPQNNSFYGGVLSTYLRSISLTIHGVVGLSMFNVVYIKGLMRGIEGLYLITTINESITPASFSTSLECKLIQYKDKNPDSNPLAGDLNITLEDAAKAAKGTGRTDFDVLFDQTEETLKNAEGGVEVE